MSDWCNDCGGKPPKRGCVTCGMRPAPSAAPAKRRPARQPLRERLARTLQALRKIDAVYTSASTTHGGHLECDTGALETALEDVRDLIGPALPSPPATQPLPPGTRTEAEKQRAVQVRDVGSYAELMRRLK